MAKELVGVVKLHITGGQATPGPPVGTSLGKFGINLGQFVQQVNDRTRKDQGLKVPIVVRVYKDKTFEIEVKQPLVSELLKKEAQIVKGSGNPPREKVARLTRAQIEAIAKRKMVDMNVKDLAGAIRVVEGAARSMGIEVVD
ncbi:MAG: 50S ribosomal protein L11 [Thermoguttaceae bacterium]|nr:50S ribosomal protein L11 [Thermoguttaceae bacterium]MDW8079704.1 50S ribosomal protein L11 [Thermoguttaceae bacterium]